MPQLEDSSRLLTEFGLTPYEAKVYLSVYKHGLTTASNIAKLAKIRREEVYRTLPKLERAGFIERVLGRPTKVRALPIEDVLSILISRKEEDANREIRKLVSKKSELLDMFEKEPLETKYIEDKSHFTLISERDAIEKRIMLLIRKARKSIEFVDTFENAFRFVLTFADDLLAAKRRNIEVRIITECPDNVNLIPDALRKHVPEDSFDIRYFEDLPGNYILFDGNQALITTSARSAIPDGRCLWTDDPSLVGIVQNDFNKILHDSVEWKALEMTSDTKLMRILRRLKPRDHAILIYDSKEAKHNTLFSYIQKGLRKGEVAAYICSEETPDEIRAAMRKFGIEVDKYQDAEALVILPYTEMYIRDGTFNIESIMEVWGKFYDDAMSKGFSGMRVTGEMSCFIEHDLVEELIDYEQALHTILDIPMVAICAYNAEVLSSVENPIDVYSELVKAHGKVLFAGKDNNIGKIEIRAS